MVLGQQGLHWRKSHEERRGVGLVGLAQVEHFPQGAMVCCVHH